MLIGYAHVSTTDQNLALQKEALEKAGCERIYEDTISETRAERPGLAKALEMLRCSLETRPSWEKCKKLDYTREGY